MDGQQNLARLAREAASTRGWPQHLARLERVGRHPRGGGHLVPHRHPYLPQKVAIFLNLSEPGVDYASGAAVFRNAGGWVDTFADFRCGDLLAWRYDLVHGISAVEPEAPLTWEGDDGLWIAAMERFEAHPHSSVA